MPTGAGTSHSGATFLPDLLRPVGVPLFAVMRYGPNRYLGRGKKANGSGMAIEMTHGDDGLFNGADLFCVRGERAVFHGLGFSIGPGDALLLVGPNGSGKSSLLRLMAGLLRPRAGTVSWSGISITDDPESHGGRLHYVGHLDAVKPALTVAENVSFWASMRTNKSDGIPSQVARALDAFTISHLADVPGRFLSAGQKRRVSLARLIAAPAPLWLLDEPTTALDAASVTALEGLIRTHRAGGGMVVASTHAEIGLDGASRLDLGAFQPTDEAMTGSMAGGVI